MKMDKQLFLDIGNFCRKKHLKTSPFSSNHINFFVLLKEPLIEERTMATVDLGL